MRSCEIFRLLENPLNARRLNRSYKLARAQDPAFIAASHDAALSATIASRLCAAPGAARPDIAPPQRHMLA